MSQSILLSPMDQYMPRIYTNLFLIFKTPDPARAVDSLKVGLQRLNQRLPYLKGRIFAADGGRVGLRWEPIDDDIKLQEMPISGTALSELSFTQLEAEGAPVHYFRPSFVPLPRMTNLQSDTGAPVLAVNYAVIDGGVIVGLSTQHNVMDGTGVFGLIRFWADCTRSEHIDEAMSPDPEELLHRDRLLKLATGQPTTQSTPSQSPFEDLLAGHPELTLRRQPEAKPATTTTSPPKGTSRIFTLNTAKLNTTKAALQSLVSTSSLNIEKQRTITTNSVLCALAWSCITRIRAARRGQTATSFGATHSKLGFGINGRTRWGSTPPGTTTTDNIASRSDNNVLVGDRPFLGNVILIGLAEVSVPKLVGATAQPDVGCGSTIDTAGLLEIVEAITNAIQRVTPDYIAEVMQLVERAPNAGHITFALNNFHGPDLEVTSWANMGVYECDFGEDVGRPAFMRVPESEVDGFMLVLPRKRGVGELEGIEVFAVMSLEDMEVLERDAVWGSYLV